MKFGGTSVSDRESWRTIRDEVVARLAEGLRPVVVHSALTGISSRLEDLLAGAVDGEYGPILDDIRERHYRLAAELELDGDGLLESYLAELREVAAGLALVKEVSYRLHARVLAMGELMATVLGAAYLRRRGVDARWWDVRESLQSDPRKNLGERARYLAATCSFAPDGRLQSDFARSGEVIVTQGFIARDPNGATVLLGRGGSDTTAAYLAARLRAARLEIWTDVPGMFSADPRAVPSARLLRMLAYHEAQEIATTGGRILHPACLPPVRQGDIPVTIRCTRKPSLDGTTISSDPGDSTPRVKAVCVKAGLTLVSLETIGMWRQVGYLADVFRCFSGHGISIDLVSTSETNVTVSLDDDSDGIDTEALDLVIDELSELGRVRVIRSCAAISLVGRHIRAILHKLGPALEVFEEQRIHLVSQAANDLNFTFVVDESQSERLVQRLHELLIRPTPTDPVLGETWAELHREDGGGQGEESVWWRRKREILLRLAPADHAVYVYDLETLEAAAASLLGIAAIDRVLYAVKANANVRVIECFHRAGLAFECVSPGEVRHVLAACPGIEPRRILFTPNFAPRRDYEFALSRNVWVTLDSVFPLRRWPELFEGQEIFVRIDPGKGKGHHKHVNTAGHRSKFGVPLFELDELAHEIDRCGARVVGLHAHTGSGIRVSGNWRETAILLSEVAERFPEVRVLNLGGGLGVPERPSDVPLDLVALSESLQAVKSAHRRLELWLEPGRFLVAEAGVLLGRVTQTKGKLGVRYVGINTGMNSFIRPALYGAYHEIVNLSRLDEPATELVNVVGPICETGDQLGSERLLPPSAEGDIILVANAGAYGSVMSSHYNLREPAREIVI